MDSILVWFGRYASICLAHRGDRPAWRCPSADSLLELVGLKFTSHHVARINLRKVPPLLRQVIQREDGGHWADGHAGSAIDALYGIDIQLLHFIEAWPAII